MSSVRINKLSRRLVDKIAAGEVVERPSSVIKELVENALDAGARRVDVFVEGAGSKLIRVIDDGHGIHRDDMRLAVTSHATSKIKTTEDLFKIGSLGFRGEALASIAAVSHLRLSSRTVEGTGAELKVDGGAVGSVQGAGLPVGTRVEVGDLFFNVPARRAYLRTERGELRKVLSELKRQALARPEIHFRVLSDGKPAIEAPRAEEPRERIAQLLGRELAEDLLPIQTTEGEQIRIRGYVSPCDRSRGDSQQQFFFLNGRAVRDVALLTAVRTAYANLLPPRRHPIVLLWIDLDPEDVDVNVHPQKAEVRFRHEREVFRLVVHALRETLRASGLVSELRLPPRRMLEPGHPGAAIGSRAVGLPFPTAAAPEAAAPPPDGVGRYLQIQRRYVIEESEDGLRVVDPHALHERILYEEIRARLDQEPLESQRFLFPPIIELGPEERAAIAARRDPLARLGFELAPFGANAVAVHAAPRLLAAERIGDTLRQLLGDVPERDEAHADVDPDRETGLIHDLAAHLACRSAVRFGEALSNAQIEELLARRASVERGHCCPHGRPTAFRLSLDELDHRFGRQGLVRTSYLP